ncbi:ArsC family reductase [Parashewanella spongiae]|uniref:ArsC family reductase n=1 Tax=Parashewanella spongiae TaxID=342950 RepID=A0A3A6U2V0_9GAMM|nr:ArsC family reductase [Parashewanella spongiae]MCL1079545.1 ArsC family reductase [Parashewanella spongiae]RJY07381.1 ArsC family reductase [Parashewanella spongiae]
MKLYGIKNCDTVRRARKWLESNKINYSFHDLREDGLTEAMLQEWADLTSWELLFNKRSTSFRSLTETQKSNIIQSKAISLMVEHPTLVKRPILINNKQLHIGFKPAQYQELFIK